MFRLLRHRASTALPIALAVLGMLALASSATAIHFPCDQTCFGSTPGTARCSYFDGDGNCPAYPDPCYMICSKFWSCTAQPFRAPEAGEERASAQDLATGDAQIVFGLETETWLEAMSHRYGPCLELVPFEGEGTSAGAAAPMALGERQIRLDPDEDSSAVSER